MEKNKKTSNSTSNIHPILLLDGNDQCWFNSTLQLINSAVECAPQEVLSKFKPDSGYVLVEFLNYLREESNKFFNENKNHILNKSSKADIDGLLLYDKFKEFERTLSNKQLQAWNDIPDVKEGKKIIDTINEWPGGRPGNGTTAMAILDKIFPEIKELFLKNWGIISLKQFDLDNFNTIRNTPSDKIPYNLKNYFVLDNFQYYFNDISQEQIENNQWRIGFDNNDNFAIYTIRGLQLFVDAKTSNPADNNFVTHAALSNCNNTWHFSDTVGYNSNPNEILNIFEPTEIQTRDFGKREDDYNNMFITAFMYRKMTNEEIKQYIIN